MDRPLSANEVQVILNVPLAAAEAGRWRTRDRRYQVYGSATEWAEHLSQEIAAAVADRLGGVIAQEDLEYAGGEQQVRSYRFHVRVPASK